MSEQPCTAAGCDCPGHTFLCVTHDLALEQALDDLVEPRDSMRGEPMPTLLDELTTTITRQDRMGGGNGGRRSAETGVSWKESASQAERALRGVLEYWSGLAIPYQTPPLPLVVLARKVRARVRDITLHPDAGHALADITSAVEKAEWAINRPPERWFAGVCGLEGCPGQMWATLGDDDQPRPWAVCDQCRARVDMAARRDNMLRHARDCLVTAALASRALPMLFGHEISVKTIRTWASTGVHPDTGRVIPLKELRTTHPAAQPRLRSHRSPEHPDTPAHRLRDIIQLAIDTPTRNRRTRHATPATSQHDAA